MNIRKVLSNKIIVYMISQYGGYALQFLVGMIVAAKLGPYYLGVYGFINLILTYFSQINFGIPHSLNVLLVHNKGNREAYRDYIGNSFAIYAVVSLVVLTLWLLAELLGYTISEKYVIDEYYIPIFLIAVITYFNSLLFIIARFCNKVLLLALTHSTLIIVKLSVVFFFDGKELITALVIAQLVSLVINSSLILRTRIIPSLKDVRYRLSTSNIILKKGWYLFLYNSAFYFILISLRTLISRHYTVEEFGLFNFSYNLADAVLLLITAIMSIIFPKIIHLLSTNDYEKIQENLQRIRVSFVSTSHLLMYVAMCVFPAVIYFMPKYEGTLTSMNLIGLSVLMNTNSYGYTSLLIAQNKERISAFISIFALILNIVIAEILINVFHVPYSYVILSIMITYICFSMLAVYFGNKVIGNQVGVMRILLSFFPIRLLIPFVAAMLLTINNLNNLIFVPLILYILFNMKDLTNIIIMIRKMVNNPNITDV